jgi:phosphocarrier protein
MKKTEHSAELVISNKRGLHARASAKFVKTAECFNTKITVSKENNQVSGTSIMGLMLLAASKGETIIITAQGPEAELGLRALKDLVEDKFGEEN